MYYLVNLFFEVICVVYKNDYFMCEVFDKDGGVFGLEGLSCVFVNGGKVVKFILVV